MASTSGRRSGSSDGSRGHRERPTRAPHSGRARGDDRPSRSAGDRDRGASGEREAVYIGTRHQDRSLARFHVPSKDAMSPRAGGRASGRAGAGEESRAARAAREAREARESRLSSARRSARLRALAVLAVIAAIVGSCVGLYRSSLFAVRRVEVVGATHVSAARVRALARVPADATLIRFPGDAVAERVAADPWVASVTVSRLFPDGMRIRVTEREPVAMVDTGATLWLADRAGMIIAERSSEQTSTAIVIRDVPGLDPKPGRRTTSEALANAIAVLDALSSALRSRIGSVSAPTVDGTTLYTRDKVEIVFGDAAEAAKKEALVLTILNEHAGAVVSIDVRTLDRPTWRGLPRK